MKVLVANRGEIALRIIHSLREMGMASVAVYSSVDRGAPHVWHADEAVELGDPLSYLDIPMVIGAARQTGATAIHPGYGFLAENPHFVRACDEVGLVFVGPSVKAMTAFGDKRTARQLAVAEGVPVIPGAEVVDSVQQAIQFSSDVGYPILLKATAGGGGKGMRQVRGPAEMADAFDSASREAESAFGDGRLLVEKYIQPARHIEIQILGDGKDAIVLGDRECSLQRRYQKVVEEAPATSIDDKTRGALYDSALILMRSVGYRGAATVEFLVARDGKHYFLEVNTRLQVEHPVTELVTGIDVVAEQVRLAHGAKLPAQPVVRGHAIEARLNAEDAYAGYLPQTGEVVGLHWPQQPGLRIDTGIVEGSLVSPHYDSMLAKVIVFGRDREAARRRLVLALEETVLLGVKTNQGFLLDLLGRDFFVQAETYTTTIESEDWSEPAISDALENIAEKSLAVKHHQLTASESADVYSPWRRLGGFRMGL